MVQLDIPTLIDNITICFANSRDNESFDIDQRRKWLIQGIEQRQRLRQLIGEQIAEEANSLVTDANQRISHINQRLKEKLESRRRFNDTIEQIITVVGVLDQIVSFVSSINLESITSESHATVKNFSSVSSFEKVPVVPKISLAQATAGSIGTDKPRPFCSSDKLLKNRNSRAIESRSISQEFANIIIPPYAFSQQAPETIIGEDDRERILDTENLPWRMICSLSITGSNGRSFVGTGWFAGPKTIITAAHCLYDKRNMGGWANQINIYPGRDGNELLYSTISNQFEVPEKWVKSGGQDPDYDYGVIHLKESLGDKVGWFSVAVPTDADLKGTIVNISGYPGDRINRGKYQLFHDDIIPTNGVSDKRFFYEIDTFGGQSGSPVWIEFDDGSRQVVGIHTYGVGGSFRLNSATRITPMIFNNIKKWIADD